MSQSKTLKLTGVSSYNHPGFSRGDGDSVHVRKGEVIRVDEELGEYLLEVSEQIGAEDIRNTFTEVSDSKPKYDFSSSPATTRAEAKVERDKEADVEHAEAAHAAAGKHAQRVTRTK